GAILKARSEGGRFKSLTDLVERVETRAVNRKMLEALTKCGACDGLGENRATMFAQIDRVLSRAQSAAADKARGQESLFGMLQETAAPTVESAAKLPEWPQSQMLAYEKELLGFYVTGHPLTPFAPILEKYSLANTSTLASLPGRSITRIGGMISAIQQGVSKKSGKPYALVTLEDLHGTVQVLCMNENYDKYRELLQPNKALLVIGEVNNAEDKPKLFPQEILPLEDAPRKFTKQVHLRLHTAHVTPEQLGGVQHLVAAHPGRVPLFLCFMRPAGEVVFVEAHERFNVMPSLEFQHAAEELLGEETYYAKVDTAVPERQRKPWEKRNGDSGEE
ncbi:MAG TPA: OB-fold nucleic acid binding domain-containing protein, partial [Verrucomicrobiae bacterium]